MLSNVFGSPLKSYTQRSSSLALNCESAIEVFCVEHEPLGLHRWLILISSILSFIYNTEHEHITTNLCSKPLYCYLLLALTAYFFIIHKSQKETLVVIQGIGIIISSAGGIFNKASSFIALENIEGVVLFEAIRWNRIFYHMGVIVKNKATSKELRSNIFPLFKPPRIQPLDWNAFIPFIED